MYLGMENTVFLSGIWSRGGSIFMELWCLYMSRKMSRAATAERIGGTSVSALSRNRKRLGTQMGKDASLRRRFQRSTKVLNRN